MVNTTIALDYTFLIQASQSTRNKRLILSHQSGLKLLHHSYRIYDTWGVITFYFIKKNFMALFYGWGSTASRLEPLILP